MRQESVRVLGRYALYDEIAAGGMATVHVGRLLGPVGFSRTVAIKRLHTQFARDPEFVSMFLDEARLAARIRHPNVVPTLDVVALDGELFLVMEFVQGDSFARLLRAARNAGEKVPFKITVAIVASLLDGLHAAHEAKSELGEPLHIVHRDVSPQNVLVGADGVARVLDFGVAKASNRLQSTREGQLKGKLSYMAPEQMLSKDVDRRVDIFAASVVLWEALTGERLFTAENEALMLNRLLNMPIPAPGTLAEGLPAAVDEVVLKGLARNPDDRWSTAHEMALALESALAPATGREVAAWVERVAGQPLRVRAERVAEIESGSADGMDLSAARGSLDSLSRAAGGGLLSPISSPSHRSPARPDDSGSNSRVGITSLEVTHSPDPEGLAPRRRARVPIAAAAVLLVLGSVAFFALRSGDRPAGSLDAPGGSGSVIGSSSPPWASASALEKPPEAPPVASASAAALPLPPPVRTKPPSPQGSPPRDPPAPRDPPPAKGNCAVPWILDARGIRRLKPECM